MQISRIHPVQRHGRSLRHHRHRNPQGFSALTAHPQVNTRRIVLERGVHAHNVGSGDEGLCHPARQRLTPGFIRAIDLGHQRRHHRRSGRNFDHLDDGMVTRANFFQRRTQALRDDVALVAAVLLVHQIDLHIALFGIGAQVILAHQTIEGNRRCRAGIGLQVQHFRLPGQIGTQLMQGSRGVFKRRAGRHFDHHLEFALVVKRQHFQHDPLHQRQTDREQQRQQNACEQQPALFGAVQKRRQHPGKQALQLWPQAGGRCRRAIAVGVLAHHFQRQPRRHRESNQQGNGHAHAGVDRDRAHVGAHQTTDKCHRQQGRNHRQGGQNGGATHFIDSRRNDLAQAALWKQHLMAMDVFNHHNGVIDQDTDGENQREQGHPVQGEAPGP